MNTLLDCREGKMLVNPNDKYIGGALVAYGEYSEAEAGLFRQILRPGMVAVEVGANIGAHTLVLAKAVGPTGTVIAYEPQRVMFQLLCANLALNDITNVEARQEAVGLDAEYAYIPVPDYSKPGNFGGIALGDPGPYMKREVRVTRLTNEEIETAGAQGLHLLKVDVEGMEESVIHAAARVIGEWRPVLYVENDRPPKSASLIRAIWSLGYRCWWHLPPMFNPDNFRANPENIWPDGLVSINMLCMPSESNVTIEGLALVESEHEHPLIQDAA